jgi:hypothetical protein
LHSEWMAIIIIYTKFRYIVIDPDSLHEGRKNDAIQ